MEINIVSQLFSRLGVVCENLWSPNWIISPMFWSPKKSKCVWSQQIPGSSSRETTLISINLKPPKPWIQFPKTTVLSYVFQVGMLMPIYPKNHKTSNMLFLRFQPARSKERSHWLILWRLHCWFFGYKIKHWHSWHSCHESCLSNISSSNSDQTWMFPKIMVPPKSSILIGVFHYFHHPFGGVFPLFLETFHMSFFPYNLYPTLLPFLHDPACHQKLPDPPRSKRRFVQAPKISVQRNEIHNKQQFTEVSWPKSGVLAETLKFWSSKRWSFMETNNS